MLIQREDIATSSCLKVVKTKVGNNQMSLFNETNLTISGCGGIMSQNTKLKNEGIGSQMETGGTQVLKLNRHPNCCVANFIKHAFRTEK